MYCVLHFRINIVSLLGDSRLYYAKMTEPTPKNDDTKSDDKRDIELEEREQMMNADNNKTADNSNETESENAKNKLDTKEGREVKPKKIPIGGIQMPGFFTRSKSKERCKVSLIFNFCWGFVKFSVYRMERQNYKAMLRVMSY